MATNSNRQYTTYVRTYVRTRMCVWYEQIQDYNLAAISSEQEIVCVACAPEGLVVIRT